MSIKKKNFSTSKQNYLESSSDLEIGQNCSHFFHLSFISIKMGIFKFHNQFWLNIIVFVCERKEKVQI